MTVSASKDYGFYPEDDIRTAVQNKEKQIKEAEEKETMQQLNKIFAYNLAKIKGGSA